jgi:hypothetical protein
VGVWTTRLEARAISDRAKLYLDVAKGECVYRAAWGGRDEEVAIMAGDGFEWG